MNSESKIFILQEIDTTGVSVDAVLSTHYHFKISSVFIQLNSHVGSRQIQIMLKNSDASNTYFQTVLDFTISGSGTPYYISLCTKGSGLNFSATNTSAVVIVPDAFFPNLEIQVMGTTQDALDEWIMTGVFEAIPADTNPLLVA